MGQRLIATMKKHTVLIVEDNDINRDILQSILQSDYHLLTATNGLQGLNLLRERVQHIDIVLLDLEMPVMSGYEVLEAVREDTKLQHIPIIVTTGNEGLDEEERCLKLHATDFIKKPYNPHIVRLRIESLIRMREFAATLTDVERDKRTGVYTRNAFMHYAQEWISNSPEIDFTLSMTDVHGFKLLHEQFGDSAYEVLRKEAELLRSYHPKGIMIGAYSDDQMLILHPTRTPDAQFDDKSKWYEACAIHLSEQLHITIKAGVCEHIDTRVSLVQHVHNVHAALSEAKRIYNRYSHFVGPELLVKLQRKDRIEELMEEALRCGEMQVYYQPKHDAKTEKLIGAEALLRWTSPELGFVSPGEFIPIFEQNGFVSEADNFVWTKTCQYLRRWSDLKLPVVPISVNVSRRDFSLEDLDTRILEPLRINAIPESLLHLEITESLFNNLSDNAIKLLLEFRNRGIQVELDDFGTGYSSLNSLSELPVDIVKFDMSFVHKLYDRRKQLVMKGCLDMLKHLHLKSVAEGVEDNETRQLLVEMGIDSIQGYYYAKPMPAPEFEQYFKEH